MEGKQDQNRRNTTKRVTKGEGLSLYFGNLHSKVDTDLLLELVSQVGIVTNMKIMPSKNVERESAYAFVELATVEDAAYVQRALDGIHLYGEKLFVKFEKKR